MLKRIFQTTIILVCFLVSASFAQLPTASDFFPLKVGNIWQHQHYRGSGAVIQSEVVSDSLIGDTLVVYKLRFKAFQDPPIPDDFAYRNYNRDSTVVYGHGVFPQNPFDGFPYIDTHDGLQGRWHWLFGDYPATLAITDTGSTFLFGQLRKWAEVNSIVEEADSFRIDETYHARHVVGVGLTRFGVDTLIYAKINGVEYGTPVSVRETEQLDSSNIPDEFKLWVYPNPVKSQAIIYLDEMPQDAVDVTIYDILGRRIRSFKIGRPTQKSMQIKWNGRDVYNRVVASGIYFVVAKSHHLIKTHKITYLQ